MLIAADGKLARTPYLGSVRLRFSGACVLPNGKW
jgi:hypothetical protein